MIQAPPLAQYLLENSICLLAFFLLYRLLFQYYTFFQLNRFYLLAGGLLSFLLPLLHLRCQAGEVELFTPVMQGTEYWVVAFNAGLEQTRPLPTLSLSGLLGYVYLSGVLYFSFVFFRKIYAICHLAHQQARGNPILSQDTSSFFRWLFFHPRHQGEGMELILEHESVHIRQWHSLDVLLMELLLIANWFNPIMYLYRRSLRELHEYIADYCVTRKTQDTYGYAQLLVREATRKHPTGLVHPFASMIKKRLLMLSTNESKKRQVLAYLAVLPLSACLLVLFSFNIADPMSGWEKLEGTLNEWAEKPLVAIPLPQEEQAAQVPPILMESKPTLHLDTFPNEMEGVYQKVDRMPSYGEECGEVADTRARKKCSDMAILSAISKYIQYPKESIKNGVEGTAVVRFVVEKDGSISFDKDRRKAVLREPDRHCGDEALRVARLLQPWTPGRNGGQAVRVQYTLPIKFKLEEEKKDKEDGQE